MLQPWVMIFLPQISMNKGSYSDIFVFYLFLFLLRYSYPKKGGPKPPTPLYPIVEIYLLFSVNSGFLFL